MARPKGSTNKVTAVQGIDVTKEPLEVKDVKTTVVKEVKVVVEKVEENPLRKGDLFLFIVGGEDTYWTRTQALVSLQRGLHDIEIPKGSDFVAPANSKCKGCG